MKSVIIKITFKKAYDKVKWSFLQYSLEWKIFSNEWLALIYNFVFEGSVAIKLVNTSRRKKIKTRRSTLSHMLLNIVVDMLVISIKRAKIRTN
jgi:hypothetical protein